MIKEKYGNYMIRFRRAEGLDEYIVTFDQKAMLAQTLIRHRRAETAIFSADLSPACTEASGQYPGPNCPHQA